MNERKGYNWRLINADVIDGLRALPDASIHCCITSPPYWGGIRDYGTGRWEGGSAECRHSPADTPKRRGEATSTLTGMNASGHPHAAYRGGACPRCGAVRVDQQIGLERTPEEYIAKLVAVFREVRRVLRSDGCLWINIGDVWADTTRRARRGIRRKDLIGVPWMLAFALRADGWYLRQEVIWHKPTAMPESVTDRPHRDHEQIFLLTKSARYFYDAEAVRQPGSPKTLTVTTSPRKGDGVESAGERRSLYMETNGGRYHPPGHNLRSIWSIPSEPLPDEHYAAFPTALPSVCIQASTSERGCCAVCGAQWRRITQRSGAGIGRSIYDHSIKSEQGRRATTPQAKAGRGYTIETLGWRTSCKCDAGDPVDCLVLDPFAGAASTGVSALRLGRRFIGIELSARYCEIAEHRLRETERNAVGDLFLPYQETQGELFI